MHKKYILIGLIVAAILVVAITTFLVGQSQDPRQRADGTSPTATPSATLTPDPDAPIIDPEEASFIEILNEHRQSLGRGELKASYKLTKAAEWMSNDMATTGNFSHTDSLGREPEERFSDFGYSSSTGSENLAKVGATGQSAFDGWLGSSGHKANMESGSVSAIGIARVKDPNSNIWYWTADFGSTLDEEITPAPTLTVTESPTITPTTPTLTPSGPPIHDCGTQALFNSAKNYPSFQCLLDKALACSESKLLIDATYDYSSNDVVYNESLRYSLSKNSNGKCLLTLDIDELVYTQLPSYMTDEEKEELEAIQKGFSNTQGVCEFAQVSDLVYHLTRVKDGSLLASEDPNTGTLNGNIAVCTGRYFDLLNQPPSITPTPTRAPVPTRTPTPTKVPTPTPTRIPTPAFIATTSTPTPTVIPTLAATSTPTAIPTQTPTSAPTPTIIASTSTPTPLPPIGTTTPTPTISQPGSVMQTVGLIGGIILAFAIGIFLLII